MKNLALILGLIITASPAFASRARLESLGEGKNGSYYINDSRNIFLNPAQIVKHKKKLWLEFGGEPGAVQDTAATPRGQGGFSNTFGDFTYGLYLNQNSERTLQTIATANGAGSTFVAPTNAIEGFFAGEGAMNWGLSVWYGSNAQDTRNANQLGARVGIESGALQVFSTVGITSKSTAANTGFGNLEIKGKVGVDAGVTYSMDNWTWFGKFTTIGSDISTDSAVPAVQTAVNQEARMQIYGLGFGYTKEWSKTVTMFTRLEADYQKTTSNGNDLGKIYNMPIALGAEAQALSWLAVRGSIQQSLFGRNITTRSNFAGLTTVAAGLGATFGDVNIDGLVSLGTQTTTNVPGFGTAPTTAGNFGFGDNMLSRVAVTYNF